MPDRLGFSVPTIDGWAWSEATADEPPPARSKMPELPPSAITALAWLIVADVLLVSSLLAAYAARIARKWLRSDQ